MKTLNTSEVQLDFFKTVGKFSVLSDIILLPKIKAFSKLESLAEAETHMQMLSNLAFGGKCIITHGTIYGREYLFFYSSTGYFDSNRILNNKLDSLSFFTYQGLKLIVLFERELSSLYETKHDILKFFNTTRIKDSKPRLILVFESDKIKESLNATSFRLFDIFEESEAIIFLGEDLKEFKTKKGHHKLC